MNQDIVTQLVRYALLTLGPLLVSHGWVTNDQWSLIVGAAMSVLTIAWGVYVKWGTTSVPDHVAARPDVITVSPVTGRPT